MRSHPLIRATNPLAAIGQLGGHLKRGIKHPRGPRTNKAMALVSALPLAPDSDRMVLAFMDRSAPGETFDEQPHRGDNVVMIVPRAEVHLSIVNGVCPGDVKGLKVVLGPAIEEPTDLDVDNTGMDITASDAWVDMVDELGVDCTKMGGYPLWANTPIDVEGLCKRKLRFHHRIAGDLVDFKIGDGGVIYVFVDEEGDGGALCWQQSRY
jgi:hypothetical protein